MPRNLYERVEVLFPVKDRLFRERVRKEILESYLTDNVKSRLLQKDGSYVLAQKGLGRRKAAPSVVFNAQEFLIGLAEGQESMAVLLPND